MKYYLVEISEGDAKIKGKSIYEYDTKNEAIATFHSKLGTAMKSDLYTRELVMVIDSFGNVIKKEVYEKPVPVEEATEDVTESVTE